MQIPVICFGYKQVLQNNKKTNRQQWADDSK
jgi:hypothetical protein